MTVVEFTVHGKAETQGSKSAVMPKGAKRPVVLEGKSSEGRQRFHDWRHAVADEARKARNLSGLSAPLAGPVSVCVWVGLAKPASAPKRRRTWPVAARSGDVDKLARAVLDSITGVLVADDSQVVLLFVSKDYVASPGAWVRVATDWLDVLPGADFVDLPDAAVVS